MKVLLREKVDKVGERGEIIDVKEGFARNFLLPRKLAVPATNENFKQLDAERARIERIKKRERVLLEEARAKLEQLSCTIVAAASPEGHLYGSVGPKEIAEAFSKEGVAIDENNVKLEQHFKETGVFLVELELGPDLKATTRIWITSDPM